MVFLIQFFYISGISHHFCGYLLSFQCPIAGSVSDSIKSVRLLSLWSSISQNLCIFFFSFLVKISPFKLSTPLLLPALNVH